MTDRGWNLTNTTSLLRSRCAIGVSAFGPWITTGSPYTTEILAHAGFDWIALDAQHGEVDRHVLPSLLRAVATANVPVLVRVSGNSTAEIGWALDCGANGVIVPMVDNPEQAADAVAACRYVPSGRRSWGALRPALADSAYDSATANSDVLCFVMAETPEACDNAERIAAVEGVDGIFIGPNDLAIACGVPRSLDTFDRVVAGHVARVLAACLQAGIIPGIYAGGAAAAHLHSGAGFRLVGLHSDAVLVAQGAQELRRQITEYSKTNRPDGE